jgi:DNA replication and repair protein RecF
MQIRRTERSDKTSIKKVKINNVAKSLSKFTLHLNSVLFSPEDIDIITGSPAQRRKYLDLVLYQVDQKYKKYSTDYQKAVRRRNKILELISETGTGEDQLPFWNDKILELGEYVQQKRSELLNYINRYFTSSENPYSKYSNNLKTTYEQNLIDTKRLHEYKNREIRAKTTLIGPHRDDFSLYQQEKGMSQFASRGEQRTAMFLMKLAEFDFIYSNLNIKPILLLDDIFSELDPEHREAILSFINDQQTIITTSSATELPQIHISKTINLS